MMNLVGELVLARNQVLHSALRQSDASFANAAQRLKSVTSGLQESVMKARMQPIGKLWNKLPRLVRDMAAQCGKQIAIEMKGSEIELDRTILEAMKDPLTHILRNAIDHGIESPERRAEAGKTAAGHVSLSAFHEGGRVHVEISDDGAGINLPRVRERAAERGLITAQQAASMNEQELTRLVFTPGFSTAETVTNLSGRGVGLDVVKTNIERIGGIVDLQSVTGQGTTLKINLPLTLAVLPALIVSSGGERFAIPQASLIELVRLEPKQEPNAIEHVYGAAVYRWRDGLLPLVFLDCELQLPPQNTEATYVVVLEAGAQQFGLVVDAISDTEEIVIKPLGRQLRGLACFAGAAILGDGRVALILDVAGVAQLAKVATDRPAAPRKRAPKTRMARPSQPRAGSRFEERREPGLRCRYQRLRGWKRFRQRRWSAHTGARWCSIAGRSCRSCEPRTCLTNPRRSATRFKSWCCAKRTRAWDWWWTGSRTSWRIPGNCGATGGILVAGSGGDR